MQKTKIEREDVMFPESYAPVRQQKKQALIAIKKNRRVEIGPVATCYFECFETMVHQINEMLYIEKGGEDQLKDELLAYDSLVPNGSELTATVMFEIDEPVRRKNFLSKLGGIEETMFIKFGDHLVMGVPEADVDRTTADGKASSVQFLHFPFTHDQIAEFKQAKEVIMGFKHEHYGHMVAIPQATHQALAKDFAE
ncbi:MAG: DUF3501 family protein [Alphaproteobacteria bacterium]